MQKTEKDLSDPLERIRLGTQLAERPAERSPVAW
jgi:hypothetical protein